MVSNIDTCQLLMKHTSIRTTLRRTACAVLATAMLVSCTSVKDEAVQIINVEAHEEMRLHTEIEAKAETADPVTWAEIQRRAKEAEEARKQKDEEARLAAEAARQAEIEAEKAETERARLEAEAEAAKIAEEQRIAEEARIVAEEAERARLEAEAEAEEQKHVLEELERIQEESEKVKILDEEEKELPDNIRFAGDPSDAIVIPHENEGRNMPGLAEITEDRILEGDPSNSSVPSWLQSPTERAENNTSVINVSMIQEVKEEEPEKETFAPEDILDLGKKYDPNREKSQNISKMSGVEIAGKAIDIIRQVLPILIILGVIIVTLFLLRFLHKKVINPKKKTKEKKIEGVEVVSDGMMTVKLGAGADPDSHNLPQDIDDARSKGKDADEGNTDKTEPSSPTSAELPEEKSVPVHATPAADRTAPPVANDRPSENRTVSSDKNGYDDDDDDDDEDEDIFDIFNSPSELDDDEEDNLPF